MITANTENIMIALRKFIIHNVYVTGKSGMKKKILFAMILYFAVNNFSIMSGWILLGLTSTIQRIKCLAQAHNAVPSVRLKPTFP